MPASTSRYCDFTCLQQIGIDILKIPLGAVKVLEPLT